MSYVDSDVGDYIAQSEDFDWDPALDEVAEKVAGFARGFAAGHVRSGHYLDSIGVEVDRHSPSGRDRLIFADDENAQAIEFGHVTADGSFVDGLHVMGRAADAVGGGDG